MAVNQYEAVVLIAAAKRVLELQFLVYNFWHQMIDA